MPGKLIAQQEMQVGKPTVIEAPSPTPPFVVVFEDDGSTGYFYAVDMSREKIIDALHIYNVISIADRHLPSKIEIVWSQDDKKAELLINGHPHAIFDFEAQRGYCRTGFPPPSKNGWTKHGHEWDNAAEELFK